MPCSPPDVEGQLTRRQAARCFAHVVPQHGLGARGVGVARAVDVTDAPASRQPDVPGPALFMCRGNRVRRHLGGLIVVRHLQRHRVVDEQHVAFRHEGHSQRAADELGAEAGAVHVQPGGERAVLFGDDARDGARNIELDARNRADVMPDAERTGETRQVRAEAARIQVMGIVHRPAECRIRVALRRTTGVADLFLQGGRVGPGDRASLT